MEIRGSLFILDVRLFATILYYDHLSFFFLFLKLECHKPAGLESIHLKRQRLSIMLSRDESDEDVMWLLKTIFNSESTP